MVFTDSGHHTQTDYTMNFSRDLLYPRQSRWVQKLFLWVRQCYGCQLWCSHTNGIGSSVSERATNITCCESEYRTCPVRTVIGPRTSRWVMSWLAQHEVRVMACVQLKFQTCNSNSSPSTDRSKVGWNKSECCILHPYKGLTQGN